MSRHGARVKWLPMSIVRAMATRDRYAPLDWTKSTRLDQEINRIFVYWKTTREEREDPQGGTAWLGWLGQTRRDVIEMQISRESAPPIERVNIFKEVE